MQHAGRLHVSILTVGELLTWALRRDAPPRRISGIEDFLSEVNTLPICRKVAEKFAELRAGQLESGQLTPSIDLWIAATAITHELTLVTHNIRDYNSIPGLSDYQLMIGYYNPRRRFDFNSAAVCGSFTQRNQLSGRGTGLLATMGRSTSFSGVPIDDHGQGLALWIGSLLARPGFRST